jgi:ribosomal protein S18 acetylase RimI-like enzyme
MLFEIDCWNVSIMVVPLMIVLANCQPSVLSTHRGRGIGAAVAAASIVAFAKEGVRVFTAGGAAVNASSLGLVRSMGFHVDEQWRSYERD